jgi:hypothetical protein
VFVSFNETTHTAGHEAKFSEQLFGPEHGIVSDNGMLTSYESVTAGTHPLWGIGVPQGDAVRAGLDKNIGKCEEQFSISHSKLLFSSTQKVMHDARSSNVIGSSQKEPDIIPAFSVPAKAKSKSILQSQSAEDENRDRVELLLLKTWLSFSNSASFVDRGMKASA